MDVNSNSFQQPNSANAYLVPLDEYKDAVVRLFPALPKRVVENWSIFRVDALAIGYFLRYYPRSVVVLEIGTFIGTSAFCFARHPNVTKVVSVDPNPTIFDELSDKRDEWGKRVNLEPLKDLKVLDVARTVLSEFSDEREKIQLLEGVVGSSQVGVKEQSQDSPKKIEVPVVDYSDEVGVVAFVDGLHTREGVQADLTAIFERNPHAVAILDDCRHAWGPYVQAGIVDFMQQASDKYRFNLIGDLGPGLATSNLGIVYPHSFAAEAGKILKEIKAMFSQRLDPLRLLSREEMLIRTVNGVSQELHQMRKTNSHLKTQIAKLNKRNSEVEKRKSDLTTQVSRLKETTDQLSTHYSSRRYAVADAVADKALRIPGLKSLVRRNTV
jgi:hypothetical protein